MVRRSVVLGGISALGLAAVLVMGACGPTYPECASDEHCRDQGEYCVNKMCKQCRDDSHCSANDPCRICDSGFVCTRRPGCCQSDADCPGGRCVRNPGDVLGHCEANPQVVATETPIPQCTPDPVYFDFNQSKIRIDQKPVLERAADCLRQRSAAAATSVRLEGNCDERGTEEYNLALGSRRANAVKQYLGTLGIGSANLSTLSYGKERPICSESAEDCWWRCRRTDMNLSF